MTEGNLQLQDMDNGNRRAAGENSELLRKLEEVDGNIGSLNKAKISLTNQGRQDWELFLSCELHTHLMHTYFPFPPPKTERNTI